MRRFQVWLCCLAVLALAATAPGAAETHPFSVHDMVAFDRISDPQVSPDGRRVVFTVSVLDLAANKRRSDLYLVGTDGSGLRRLTTHEAGDNSPRWSPDGRSVYFLSARSGSSQVWRIAADGGEAEPVTKLPLDVGGLSRSRPTGRSWPWPWRSSRTATRWSAPRSAWTRSPPGRPPG